MQEQVTVWDNRMGPIQIGRLQPSLAMYGKAGNCIVFNVNYNVFDGYLQLPKSHD